MRVPSPMRIAALTLLVGGLACAKNTSDETVGAARDTTAAGVSDSANANADQSGVDSTGNSNISPDVEKTRPDQGQPVTSKGDTLNPSVDSSTGAVTDSSMNNMGMDSTTMNHDGMDSTTMNHPGMDSSSTDTSTAR